MAEGSHTLPDGKTLYTKTWKTEGPAKARVVFIHGFSDHCNAYNDFFPTLAANSIEVYSFDQRGWGRSVTKPAEKGDTGPTSQVLDDMTSFIKTVIPCPIPLFLMGHSMGGGQVLHYAAHGPAEVRAHIRGYLLESPLVEVSPNTKPSPVTVFLGRLAGKLLPRRQMVNRLDASLLSRDPAIVKQFEEDDLCHDTGTLEGLAGLLDRTNHLSGGKIRIGDSAGEGGVTRIWVSHGDQDGVTSHAATKKFADECVQAQDKEFKTYEGYYHCLHNEPSAEKTRFVNDVRDWILQRSVEPPQIDSEPGKPKL